MLAPSRSLDALGLRGRPAGGRSAPLRSAGAFAPLFPRLWRLYGLLRAFGGRSKA